jgi:hypothetical protein
VDYSRVDESSVESREAELRNQEVAEPRAEVGKLGRFRTFDSRRFPPTAAEYVLFR